jgi:hypothetical protein
VGLGFYDLDSRLKALSARVALWRRSRPSFLSSFRADIEAVERRSSAMRLTAKCTDYEIEQPQARDYAIRFGATKRAWATTVRVFWPALIRPTVEPGPGICRLRPSTTPSGG